MAEACALLLFAAAIVVCATTGVSVVFALCFGFFVFTGYGLFKGFTLRARRTHGIFCRPLSQDSLITADL